MNLFNSVIMLFVVHPFDVGDALLICTNTTATGPADYCVVEELSLVVTPLLTHQTCLLLLLLFLIFFFGPHFTVSACLLYVCQSCLRLGHGVLSAAKQCWCD